MEKWQPSELKKEPENYQSEKTKSEDKNHIFLLMLKQQNREFNETIMGVKEKFDDDLRKLKTFMEKQFSALNSKLEMQKNNSEPSHRVGEEDSLIKTRLTDLETKLEVDFKRLASNVSSRFINMEKKFENKPQDLKKSTKPDNHHTAGILHRMSPLKVDLNMKLEYRSEPPEFAWNIPDILNKLNQNMKLLAFDEFVLKKYPFKARVGSEVDKNNFVKLTLQFLAEHSNEQLSNLKPWPRVYYVLKDQSGNLECKDIIRSSNKYHPIPKSNSTFDYFATFNGLELSKSLYNESNALLFEIYVESPEKTRKFHSNNGILESSVDNYSQRKQMEEKGLIDCHLSPCFYSSPRGYRLQADIHLNGKNEFKDQGLSFFIVNIDGEFDDELDESFSHKTTVVLFNPWNFRIATKSLTSPAINIPRQFHFSSRDVHEILFGKDVLYYKIVVEKISKREFQNIFKNEANMNAN